MTIINATNIRSHNLSECHHFIIRIVGKSWRRGTSNRTNCSGYNINQHIYDGMTVEAYQEMVTLKFDKNDPQFSLTKHLRYDIEKGFIELHGPSL
ncbi:hypothetical protein TUM17576_46360 [Enterobacter hormaechei]|jgi:hypothetical protein|uniref:Uncharacterized protein n=1 Tax=Phytobacter ursingii TaxID=1972431 RepID=A0AB35RI53_9ENTR|nr:MULTISPECIES: hypothetical protein [Enterobacteriaceae]MDV2861648.1 hypothetical protein [Phytobacter ursingii]GJL37816.1 hypothetical protein TUM17576_46360 [Enterobacter hormaechei]